MPTSSRALAGALSPRQLLSFTPPRPSRRSGSSSGFVEMSVRNCLRLGFILHRFVILNQETETTDGAALSLLRQSPPDDYMLPEVCVISQKGKCICTRSRLTAPLCALSQYSFAKNWGGAFEVLPAPWSRRTSDGRVEDDSTEDLSVVGFHYPKHTGHLLRIRRYVRYNVLSLLYIPAYLVNISPLA